MNHDFSILLSGYMAGVVFGSMVSVTLYRAMFGAKNLQERS
jgi:hypothetical protein